MGELDLELALSKEDGGDEVLFSLTTAALPPVPPMGEFGELDLLLPLVLSAVFSVDK